MPETVRLLPSESLTKLVTPPHRQRISRPAALASKSVDTDGNINELFDGVIGLGVPVHHLNRVLPYIDAVGDFVTLFTRGFADELLATATDDPSVEDEPFEEPLARNAFALAAGVALG